ncbi:zinc transporter ZIP13 [Alosa alosa]|uniref:zinc transporter ZIP13 n=1 Tax=Alosa alosa TaxID=278164 RepID=UPI00201537A4|nr:zinc transporter ZIP13 [Alosa alosa]
MYVQSALRSALRSVLRMSPAAPLRPVCAAAASLLVGAALLAVACMGSSGGRQMAQTAVAQATVAAAGPGPWCAEELLGFRPLAEMLSGDGADVWICSLAGAVAVGLSGIFPLLVIPIEAGAALKTEAGSQKLKRLLSFAIGGLLGDVFLHLLPEAWAQTCTPEGAHEQHYRSQGLWVLLGLLSFLLLEKMFPDEDTPNETATVTAIGGSVVNSSASCSNGFCHDTKTSSLLQPPVKIKTSGYLNLLANCIDNFTHGLAVAGSFLVSRKVGFLTTFAILLHEIPHEVGDFAILLRAGFDRWSAARMQFYTALGGVLGACFALSAQSQRGAEGATAWILPFTSGGFLYIALVNVVPDLLEETNPRESLLQILLLCCGIAVMAILSVVVD